jgi:signal transduction histidine kinase
MPGRIFISYSKAEPKPTQELADFLTAQGYTVWWDTNLTSGEVFREVIDRELDAADAVIVIWTVHSIVSNWVIAEADHAARRNRLITVRTEDLEPWRIPKPYNTYHSDIVDQTNLVLAAVRRLAGDPVRGDDNGIAADAGELAKAKAVADEARAKAEAANLAKSKFLANMSHELRTPLNVILGFSELIKDEVLGPIANAKYKAYAADIHAAGEHLLRLINEILDLSRIEAGRYELTESAVDLQAAAKECAHLLRLDAQAKKLRLLQAFEASFPRVFADERAIRQICLNLLSNAIKFTPENGVISLRTGVLPIGDVFLSVKDNGLGIPEDEIQKVMGVFGQGSLAQKMSANGLGLGLPIVAGLAELHGGHFELRSKVGVGTEAILILPKSRVISADRAKG